jgi:cytochrome P450
MSIKQSDIEKKFDTLNISDPDQSVTEAIELFDAARSGCPVAHSSKHGGYYVLLKNKDVRKAMLDSQGFASGPSASRPLADNPADQFRFPPLDYDGEEHSFWRQLFVGTINAKAASRVHDHLKADLDAILDEMIERGHGDIATEVGDIIPARAIFYLLGIDDTGGQRTIFELNRKMLAEFDDPVKRTGNLKQIAQFAWEELQKRKANPREDALTVLANATRDGVPIDKEGLGSVVTSMLAGGSGTTATAIADLLFEVLSRPAIRRQLLADRSLVAAAVEESLRLHTPFFGLYRRATKQVEIGGETLPENSSFLMCWQSANLDPESFDEPHAFRLDRKPVRHLTFGLGRHACPGSPLARMELNLVLERILDRCPTAELANEGPIQAKFIGGNAVAIPSLPVVFPR